MRLSEQATTRTSGSHDESVTPRSCPGEEGWARDTRQVLTRDLLVRARHARPGEARALEFRALHLNLSVVGEASERLGLSDTDRARGEHAALGGLLEAVRLYDPYGEVAFADFAAPYVARRLVPRPGRRS